MADKSKKRKWLLDARNKKALTRQKLAEEIGISISYIEMLEGGRRTPKPEMAKRIAGYLGFDWTKFFQR